MTGPSRSEELHWLLLGCGYSLERLAQRLTALGARVTATTRDPKRAADLRSRLLAASRDGNSVSVAVVDPGSEGAISPLIYPGTVVVNSIPPTDESGTLEKKIARECDDAGAKRIVYLSSTGVYGRGTGSWTDEQTPTGPLSERGARRLSAEQAMRTAKTEVVALRIAAIYGPGRGVQARLRRGDYRIYGDGSSKVSRIHVEDLIEAIKAAGQVSPLVRDVYCVADDLPTASREHADGIAALMGLPRPPSVEKSEASPKILAMLGSDRRISNRNAVRELGWTLRYPTWREGVAAILARRGD